MEAHLVSQRSIFHADCLHNFAALDNTDICGVDQGPLWIFIPNDLSGSRSWQITFFKYCTTTLEVLLLSCCVASEGCPSGSHYMATVGPLGIAGVF
ncbi:uncharacterized protein LOC119161086 [Rhipicephalus microplus]|uniref:uncharacterized protein LOC119161086 n=1 Tax=Rhipicephalus microplus TaxID=6941 RepID=UPI003F6BB90F